MSDLIQINRKVEVRKNVDVCIVGGGPSGVAAALTAARNGASVYLAEAHSCLGGLGTAGMVPLFMTFSDGVNFCADGIGREILDRMNAIDDRTGNPVFINSEIFKRLCEDMLLEAGVEFTFHTTLIDAVSTDKTVDYAVFNAKSGNFAVKAKIFIDCSGDGDLAACAGAEYEFGDAQGNTMPGTLCSKWANIDWQKFIESGANPRQIIFKAFEDGIFRCNDPHHTGINRTGFTLGGGNMGHTFGLNALDEKSVTEALIEGRRQAVEFERYYREYVPGYENVELACTASLLGVRESRRITGDYQLDLEDFKARRSFEDEIGRYCYPIDIHPASTEQKDQEEFEKLIHGLRYAKGENYGIPYRSLTVKGFDNLLVAGRCISADRYLQGSIRVMPGCFITGQAAGTAAAIAVEQNTGIRGFNVSELQRRLKSIGAYLPGFNEQA